MLKGMWDLSSLTRDRTRAPCTGGTESEPLDHQGGPSGYNLFFFFSFYFILLYNAVLVLPYIDMDPPRVYMSSQT